MSYPHLFSKKLGSALLALASTVACTTALACDFKPLQLVINQITDIKTPEGQKFKAQMEDGWNSTRILFDMTPKEIHPQLNECRHEVDEYLTKIGFPPVH